MQSPGRAACRRCASGCIWCSSTVSRCLDPPRFPISSMPMVTSANTNAASLMIGERGARLVLAGG